MKTDGEKLKEIFLHEKEMKMRKFEKNVPRMVQNYNATFLMIFQHCANGQD